jgi:signal peptidase I
MWKFLVLILALSAIVLFLLFDVLRVSGNSMEPQFSDGNLVIIRQNRLTRHKIEIGDIIVFTNPLTNRLNIKRCSALNKDSVFATGNNLPESTDSRQFGRIKYADIKGWVWKKI